MILALIVIVLWSLSTTLIYLGGRFGDIWQFVRLSSFIGGIFQLILFRIRTGSLRNAILLPLKLWIPTLFGLVFYSIVYPLAIASSQSASQVCGVNLINYLWPILTVILATFLIPNTYFSYRLGISIILALIGIILPNTEGLKSIIGLSTKLGSKFYLPYLLGVLAAFAWAGYSVMLSKWKTLSSQYMTTGIGFIITALLAAAIAHFKGENIFNVHSLSLRSQVVIAVHGAGCVGLGYMLWEIALSRVDVRVLGVLSSSIPVLSTIWLCIATGYFPPITLIIAACSVSLAILLSKNTSNTNTEMQKNSIDTSNE